MTDRRRPRDQDPDELLEEAQGEDELQEPHARGRQRNVDAVLEESRPRAPAFEFNFEGKPREVKEHLDEFVIGQDDAKKALANAVCYHYARVKRAIAGENCGSAGMKKNVLMIGNTGVGKTYMVSKLAEKLGVPWTRQDATRFSSTGYVGKSVDDMVRDLYIRAGKNAEAAQFGIIMLDEIDKIYHTHGYGKDVNGLEVQHRLLKLMEDTDVDLVSQEDPLVARHAAQEQTGGRPSISTRNILFIMSGRFPELERIVKRRLEDEEKSLEGDWRAQVTHEDLMAYGFEGEFVARAPVTVHLHDLSAENLYRVLTQSKESVIHQYVKDFETYGIQLKFEDDALKAVAQKASMHKTGARALVTILEDTMKDFLFDLPSTDIKEFVVTPAIIENPKEAHTILIGQYWERQSHADFAEYASHYKKEHDVALSYTKGAYASILEQSKQSGKTVKKVLEGLLHKFPLAMKLFDKTELEVNAELVADPAKYLQALTRRYTSERQ